jgi:divalent metal cation (Fe/Co/Zn/Cd) transporter
MKGLLIGEAASPSDQQAISAAIEIEPSVKRLIHLRTEHLGPEELLVAAKIELIDGLDVAEVADAINRVEASVRRAVPSARVMYLEPDVFRTSMPDDEDVEAPEEEAAPASADTGAD